MTWVTDNKKVLPKKETIRLPNEELQIDLYYNNLNNKQLAAAKQEIESTFYDFRDLYGIKQYGTDKTLSIFLHDNKKDYYDYGYTYASYCVNDKNRNEKNIANVCHNASGEYRGHDPGNRTLRNQVSYALVYYNDIADDAILPNKYVTVRIPKSNIQIKFGSNSLTDEQIEVTKENIIDAFENIKFDTFVELYLNKSNYLDGIGNDVLVSLLKEVYPNKDYDLESAKKAFDDPIVKRDVPIFLSTDGVIERSQKLLSNKEIIEFPRYNFEVELDYGNLSEYQIWRAKQEIKNTIYDFKEAFSLESSDTVRKFRILFYDTWDDYSNYTRAAHGGHADGTNAFCSLTYGYDVLRHEFMHNIVGYTGVDGDGALPTLLNHNVVGYIQRGIYPRCDNELYGGTEYIEQYLKNSEFDVRERVYFTIEFFQKIYPGLIYEVYYNRKQFENALDFFKAKFPDMVSHIPASDRNSYQDYDVKLFNKIFENAEVKQKLLDFIEDKLTEKKYIDKVNDLKAFRVVKGDHIGTDKNTDEEYYQGIIVDDKGEIGSFSPMEYSYSRKGINILNHATKDSIIIPKGYSNLKLIKVDGDYKLDFCDKHGNEYRSTQSCKNQTKDLLYTDDAQEAFTLVDLHSIKGNIGAEQNLGKIFSVGLANSKFMFSPISIYDGSKNIGSFTGEVGYVNRGKFYFKDNSSSNFKGYDENRALVVVTKENGKYQMSLRDGNYIDDDNEFQTENIKLNGSHIDSYSKERETGEISKIEHSLLFKHEPEKEEIVEFDEYNFIVRMHHELSDDKLQKVIDEIKNNLSEFKTLLDLKENDISYHELGLYVHNNENNYRKFTGSKTGYGHFDSVLNKMYISQSTYHPGGITLKPVIKIAQNHRLLPNKEILDLPEHNLQMDIYYNKLNYKQLENIKEEISQACNDFEKLHGIKESDTTNIFSIFIHDNEKDFSQYGSPYTYSYGVGLSDRDSLHVAYIFHIPDGDTLRTQVSFALTFYNDTWDWDKILPDASSKKGEDINNDVTESKVHGNGLDIDNGYSTEDFNGISYQIVNNSLHITDNETGDTIKIPKRFKYLKLEEDDKGEYKFTLCNKKGHALSDYKKYTEMDNKYKYINTGSVNYNEEEIDLDDYDEEDIFSIQPDKTDPQVIKIFDIYEDEVGMLSNSYSIENNDAYYF